MAYSPYDAYDPYDNYDGYSRPRKHSLGYRSSTPLGGYPYHDPRLGTSYSEPMMRGDVRQSFIHVHYQLLMSHCESLTHHPTRCTRPHPTTVAYTAHPTTARITSVSARLCLESGRL
jgi:hypothetical protein